MYPTLADNRSQIPDPPTCPIQMGLLERSIIASQAAAGLGELAGMSSYTDTESDINGSARRQRQVQGPKQRSDIVRRQWRPHRRNRRHGRWPCSQTLILPPPRIPVLGSCTSP